MHTFGSERGAVRALSLASHCALWAGLGLAAVSLAVGQARQAETPPQAPQPAMGEPVNLYAPNADIYAPPREDGEIHPQHVLGQVWVMTGEPSQSNVTVHVGVQGALVVDTGTQAMAPKLVAQVQRLTQEHAGDQKAIRRVVNTN